MLVWYCSMMPKRSLCDASWCCIWYHAQMKIIDLYGNAPVLTWINTLIYVLHLWPLYILPMTWQSRNFSRWIIIFSYSYA
jgi:hypothetical protein